MTDRKNILFLSTRGPFPPTNGHFQRTSNILVRMSELANIHFLGFYDKNLSALEKRHVRSELDKYCASTYLESIPADDSWPSKILLGLHGLFSSKPIVALKYMRHSMSQAVERCLAENRIHLVHLDMLPLAEYKHLFGTIPAVLTNHNVESVRLDRLARSQSNFFAKSFLINQAAKLGKYESKIVRESDVMITVSSSDSEVLRTRNPGCHFIEIPNGTDTEFFQLQGDMHTYNEAPAEVLWVGSAVDPYNRQAIDYFADQIFPLVLAKRPETVFRFVGKMSDRLRKTLQRRFGQNFNFQGFVDDVREHYARARVVCIPLLSGSGTKLKVIEALSMSRAIVTTPVGAEGLDVVGGVHLSICTQPDEIADEVLDLLENTPRRTAMESAARALAVSKYDWSKIGLRQWDAYLEIQRRNDT